LARFKVYYKKRMMVKSSKKTLLLSEKYFENAPKFKSLPQNSGKSTGFLKQMLCGTRAWSKHLLKYNLKI
jgi:hypothetical protein